MRSPVKRIISLIIALLMLFSMSATFAVEAESDPVIDMPATEAPVEETAEEPIEEPTEEPVEEPIEESSKEDESQTEPIQEEQPSEDPVEEVYTHTVTFLDGETVLLSETAAEGEILQMPEAPTKEGYVFVDWYVMVPADVDGAEPVEIPYAFDAVTGDINVYARFRPITYTVIYSMNAEAAVGETLSSVHTYDVSSVLSPCGFTQDESTFIGWALDADGEAVYSDGQEVINLTAEDGAEVVLYAVWNAALPYGFAGMPADFVLSDEQKQAKAELISHNILESLEDSVAGEDYFEDQIVFSADSRGFAETVAAAYSAELLAYSNGIALAQLTTATVLQAIEVAANPNNSMPAVSQNGIIRLDPVKNERPSMLSSVTSAAAIEVPDLQTWFDRPNDPFLETPFGDSYYDDYQWMHEAVNTYAAWGVTMGEGATVAVLDTGYTEGHEDMGSVTPIQVLGAIAFDDNGNPEETSKFTIPAKDENGHGTHVLGIVGAEADNKKGGSGIAPEADLISIRVFEGNSASVFAMTNGIAEAVSKGANIINMSLGGGGYNQLLQDEITNAAEQGVAVIVAMGNEGSNYVSYPAAYDNVIAVAATDATNTKTSFSNYGEWADVAAPGYMIMSTVPSGYDYMDGTSMACPVVSGVAALYISKMGGADNKRDLDGDGKGTLTDFQMLEKALKAAVNKSSSKEIGTGVIDASKLFGGIKDAPIFTVTDADGIEITNLKSPVPYNGKVTLSGTGNDELIIYTTDGSTPSVKNGIINESSIEYTGPIDLSEFPAGKKLTIKAMCISGMGVIGKAGTLTITLGTGDIAIGRVEITESTRRIEPGKSFTFKAAVYPETAPQDVTWYVEKDGQNNFSPKTAIDAKKGTLKTTAGDHGTLTIYAKSVADPNVVSEGFEVTVEEIGLVKTITLSEKTITMGYSSRYESASDEAETSYQEWDINIGKLSVAAGKITTNYEDRRLIPDDYTFMWTSSNDKIAEVICDPADPTEVRIVAKGVGSTTITCQALDGSGKKATCKVTVNQLVEELTITGNTAIAPGKSATYKAAVTPAKAKNKTVAWSFVNDETVPDGVTIDPKKGIVKVPKDVYEGSFTIKAIAADTGEVFDTFDVTIAAPITNVQISITNDDLNNYYAAPVLENGYLKYKYVDGTLIVSAATLLNVDIPDEAYYPEDNEEPILWSCKENAIQLTANIFNANGKYPDDGHVPIEWSSSNESIAKVEDGLVTAEKGSKGGKVTITCKATDGSNKKASVAITVLVPPSTVNIDSKSASQADNGIPLACGKSIGHTVTLGNAFGAPTAKKITWGMFAEYEVWTEDTEYYETYGIDDWTVFSDSACKELNKAVKLSGSGSLSFAKNANDVFDKYSDIAIDAFIYEHPDIAHSDDIYWDFSATVFALPQDGTELTRSSNWITYYPAEPTTTMGAFDAFVSGYNGPFISSAVITKSTIGTEYIDGVAFYADSQYSDFTITSSNPKVASAYGNKLWSIGSVLVKGEWHNAYELYLKTDAPGKATITIKANDGSNKSCKFNLTVKQGVVSLSEITGPDELQRGQSATYTANVQPKNAANKKVYWRFYSYPPQYVTLSSSGKLTVNKKWTPEYGTTVEIAAYCDESYYDAQDGWYLYQFKTITLTE